MDLQEIKAEYREEMIGAFEKLRDMVLRGEISLTSFQVAQARIYETYKAASE
jgi:hypothetical protein